MKGAVILFAFPCLISALAASPGRASSTRDGELAIQSSYEPSSEVLTTEKIWKLAPDELNPHRMRWLLDRHLELVGLTAVPEPKHGEYAGEYAARVTGLYSRAVSYLRGPKDPAYSPMSDFPCTHKPVAWFATEDGTRVAAQEGAKIWEQLLERDRVRLRIYLKHVHGEFRENAIHSAEIALARFQDGLDQEWRDKGLAGARAAEWKYYWQRAHESGVCSKPRTASAKTETLGRWESLMEPPAQGGAPKLLGRAPARRWGGLFSVLVSLKIDKLELVGKFLIDSAAPRSVISPTFLENQGALASWITVPKGVPTRIRWSGGSGVATPAYVEQAKVGGLVLPIHDFYIHDTDFFGPPESFATCCDGILGADFLRQYAVQFRPGKGPEVNLYERAGFHPPAPEPWVESYFDSGSEIVSDCAATPHARVGSRPSGPELRGVRWDTGSEDAIAFEREPVPAARKVARWDLNCGPVSMANAMAIEPTDREDQEITGLVPLDIGMELLGRGDFTLDLGHGRIWFNPQALFLPVVQNHSGLRLEFVFIDGDRYLKVSSIRKGSAAAALSRAGLRPGMTIISLNQKSVDDMDTWAVEQYLSGVFGDTVSIEWKTGKKSSKIAPLTLPGIQE